ncbi:glycoside hydrolase family 3 protein [Exilibacterium tricleocarpae]|uniref:Glycoside hydrolase family 3 protein n=1 Tax=Exilibacterium tricleocarpae TaxID=2591008 RepID=A0A545TNP0_9GAMM|nr:glycoside hydrolase family 3 N-terminal domain-containing protein [Exilibacterium tricleocarpae]TQV78835.1 glycoside hydrolase family 3 protein [Exilibacterium tricleocarpae]
MRTRYPLAGHILLCTIFAAGAGAEKPAPWYDTQLSQSERISALVGAMTLEEKTAQLLNASPAIERLKVPAYDWWNEALHGVARNGKATVFPQPIAMAATFDDALLYDVAAAIADEARAKFTVSQSIGNRTRYSGLTFWTPNINIFRDPRWGRGMETYGEDPFLTSRLGVAMVRGLQGDHPRYLKSAAAAKHYAVHSGPEALRHEFDAITTPKDLRETYLPAFEALVTEARVETVMGAYNRVNGEPANASKLLLQDILRDEWGFSGHVVSDCWALEDFHKHHKVTANAVESAAAAINAGVELNCGAVYQELPAAVKQGLVSEATIDTRLKKLLETRFKLGLFDPPEANPYNAIPASVINSEKHARLAYESAVKSIVLLQNRNGVLPLSNTISNVYVTGPMASSTDVLFGNYYGISTTYTTFLEGIAEAVSVGTTINYKKGILPYQPKVNPIDWTTGEAKAADAIIVVLGIDAAYEGEEGDAIASPHLGDRLSLGLPEHQLDFLRKLRQDNTKPVIAVVTAGSPVIMGEIAELADAVLFAWYPGQEGGTALADIVFGNRSPSGRLPITFPVSESQLPPYEDYSMTNRTYRYIESDPMYPFGFGLSYGTVKFSGAKLAGVRRGVYTGQGPLTVTAKIKNTGKTAMEEVVQVYLQAPGAGKDQPKFSLKGFQRMKLAAGDSRTVEITIPENQLRVFVEDGSAVLRPGRYTLYISNSSPGPRSRALGAVKPLELKFKI